ncbi:hypothetical protein [Sphingobium sp. R-21]|uniref:hypothetical protein n=1 Tax=Sphingobium sp. R-21 TaxID=3404056 RepID=UPI003CFB14E3
MRSSAQPDSGVPDELISSNQLSSASVGGRRRFDRRIALIHLAFADFDGMGVGHLDALTIEGLFDELGQ